MIAKIQELLEEVEKLKASNLEEVEALRIKYLSKKGSLNALMADFRNVPAEMKKEVGMKLNDLKAKAQEKIAALKEAVDTQDCGTDELDLTRTAYPVSLGTRHPLTIVKNEIVDIFSRLGFTLAEGPEIEDDWHVYSSMNFADDHPARDMQDTFFVEARPDIVLRSHNSSAPDSGMARPSAEMDISCNICGGEGCSFCKHTGWVEILGCGMVDPAVLEANGIDSSVYTGYAFGMGIERITNLKYQVKDLRMFSENDTRFLEEFKSAN